VPGYELIAIGGSWGGMHAVSRLLEDLPDEVEQPLVVALHRSPESAEGALTSILQARTRRRVREVEDKDTIDRGCVYLAPPDYHLLVERGSFALSVEERVQFARPSVDVLFESVADAYAERAVGIVLTGANRDGAAGLALIKERGGVAIVQDPETSLRRGMPDAAIAATMADAVLKVEEMGRFLYGLCCATEAAP
jgi:two-component system, chemotaxis family, protein-glutamate methylesterase/glutaminase